jgi:hypothetical protein
MSDTVHGTDTSQRPVLRTLATSFGFGAAALVAGTGLTTAGDTDGGRENSQSSAASRKEPLYVHGPTTRYQWIENHPPGVLGELENTSERTVWMARLDVEFYDEDGRQVGSRAQYFLGVRPGEGREISLPVDDDSFDDRSVALTSGVLDTILGDGRIISERTNPKNRR